MENKILLQDLTDALAKKSSISKKDAESFIKCVFQVVEENIATDNYVKIKGLGTFKLITVDARESVNVNTGERIEIQPHGKITFTPESSLKELINKPFADFETVVLNDGVDLDGISEESIPIDEEVKYETPIVIPTEESETDNQPKVEQVEQKKQEKQEKTVIDIEHEAKPEVEVITQPVIAEPEVKNTEDSSTELQETSTNHSMRNHVVIFLLILVAMLGCYFAGYYNLLCPCKDSDKKESTETVQKVAVNVSKPKRVVAKPTAVAKDSTSVKTAETDKKEDNNEEPVVEKQEKLGDNVKITGLKTTHRIKEGESLRSIAKQYYGSKKYYIYIVRYNGIKNPDIVEHGMKLRIPELKNK